MRFTNENAIATIRQMERRCSVCGHEFSAEQIGDSKREKSGAIARP